MRAKLQDGHLVTRRSYSPFRNPCKEQLLSFFDDEESARAAEARFEKMGDEIPESVRGKRVGLETYEVAFDVEMVRA